MRSDDNNELEGHRYADTMISMSMKDGISGADLTIRLMCASRAARYLGGEAAQRVGNLIGPSRRWLTRPLVIQLSHCGLLEDSQRPRVIV